jgi:molybdopterin-guanine dinucleotide biosynthesis protein A
VDAAILVGGHARRFGGCDKSALRIGSTTILERQLAVVGPLTDRILMVASDLRRIDARGLTVFLAHVAAAATGDVDVVIPRTVDGYQPLCALYARRSITPIRRRIEAGQLKVLDVLADVRVREIGASEIAPFDPDGTLFFNVNTPEDYARALTLADHR